MLRHPTHACWVSDVQFYFILWHVGVTVGCDGLQIGVHLCGHLAYHRKHSQRTLVQGGAVESLVPFVQRKEPMSDKDAYQQSDKDANQQSDKDANQQSDKDANQQSDKDANHRSDKDTCQQSDKDANQQSDQRFAQMVLIASDGADNPVRTI
eukprot:5306498-Pyramimonas_sp.AAC.1